MKGAKIRQLNYRCAILRLKLGRAYAASNMEAALQVTQQIDEYQKMLWKEERTLKKISV